ncbi:MAG: hypothetical protein PW792_15110 [Acidobacteriaceae bacterium]|nr:hypothetical protein [Acidobacteriaceae bacterium]
MKMSRFASRPANLLSSAALLALVPVLSGCALGTLNLSGPEASNGTLAIKGRAFGGLQPVIGSTIQVYTPGTTGYGTGATLVSTSSATTDSNGFFNLTGTYTCASSTEPVYVVATGGNPGLSSGTNNAAIKLVLAFSTCSALQSSSYVWINEVTTAAAAYSLSQFATTSTTGLSASGVIGAPNTTQAQLGLANAFGTVANLAGSADGNAVTTKTLTSSLGSITVTPEAAKLNTVANILAACVNSDGSGDSPCATLFGGITPSGGTTPTDTFQAAVMMNLNPTLGLSTLYGLQTATSPYIANSLSGTPNDWSLGVNFSAGLSATQTLINGANGIAVDSGGNVWIINYNSSATATESMTEFSPNGTPLVNPFSSGATSPASMAAASPRNLAIDTNNNVYVTTSSGSGYLFQWNPTSSTGSYIAVGSQPYGIAIDGSNNIFVSHNSGTTYGFEEYLGGTLAASSQYRYPFNSINQYAALTTTGNLFLAQGSTASAQVLQASAITPGSCTTGPCTSTNDSSLAVTYTPITSGTISTPYGLAAGSGGGMWVSDNGVSSVTYIVGGTGTSLGSSASFATPRYVAVDGNNNAWFTNRGTTSISAITTTGTILSPTTGSVGFQHTGMSTQNGIAVDPSGNVWVANGATSTSAAAQNSIFEMVGSAAPTVTPISLALKNGTVGVRP